MKTTKYRSVTTVFIWIDPQVMSGQKCDQPWVTEDDKCLVGTFSGPLQHIKSRNMILTCTNKGILRYALYFPDMKNYWKWEAILVLFKHIYIYSMHIFFFYSLSTYIYHSIWKTVSIQIIYEALYFSQFTGPY